MFHEEQVMTQQGGCHCGRIAFELKGEVRDVIECNCSMCRKRGGLLAFFPRAALTLKTPEADYGTYRFNKEKIAHHFCTVCGISPFSDGVHPGTGAEMACVNVRCLPGVDLAALNVQQVDGASF
jgi:hypothetical protein